MGPSLPPAFPVTQARCPSPASPTPGWRGSIRIVVARAPGELSVPRGVPTCGLCAQCCLWPCVLGDPAGDPQGTQEGWLWVPAGPEVHLHDLHLTSQPGFPYLICADVTSLPSPGRQAER